MPDLDTIEVARTHTILGLFAFVHGGDAYVGTLEEADPERPRDLVVRHVDERGNATTVRSLALAGGPSVEGVDARIEGRDLLFAVASSQGTVMLLRSPLDGWTTNGSGLPRFDAGRPLTLDADRRAKVVLSGGEGWAVAGPVAPAAWLFDPRFVRGGRASATELVLTTADGHAFGVDTSSAATAIALEDARDARATIHDGRRVVAFRRDARPYRPFWSLPAYNNASARAETSALWVAVDGRTTDLSAKVGGATTRAIATEVGDGDGGSSASPWIFAVHDGASPRANATTLSALTMRAGEWAVARTWAMTGVPTALAVVRGRGAWHVFTAVRAGDGTVLRYERRT